MLTLVILPASCRIWWRRQKNADVAIGSRYVPGGEIEAGASNVIL